MREHFEGSNVLITGGLGFIGSNLAIRLVELGANVTLVDSLVPEYGGNPFNIEPIKEKVRVNISDVRDQFSMRYLVQGQDYLFNLAGQTSHLDSMHDPFTDMEINCRAQLSILEACRLHNPKVRIVFASTRQVYGRPQYLPVDEKHPLSPVDVNGINKLAGEKYHLLYHQVYGIPTSVLRLTNTIGPRMRIKDARQTFVGIWIRNLLEGKPLEVWGGEQIRDFTDVQDAVSAFVAASATDNAVGQVFNLSGPSITLLELAKSISRLRKLGRYELRPFPADRQRIDIGDYRADDSLARAKLGWRANAPLNETLEQTMRYFEQNLATYC
jgi:UDP-glucose 4-epimerase